MRKLKDYDVTWRDILGNLPEVLPCHPLFEVWLEPEGSLLKVLRRELLGT
jgi:hypothetical protein